MIAIIADDFSGAAELAGIAAARGFKAEVQTWFDPRSDAEVIAVDTDTRLKSEKEAAQIAGAVAREISAARPEWIYKKTDSVLRGHVRAEIETILAGAGLQSCLLIPANPSRGRVIDGGRYFVEGVSLDQTLFAHDPDFPRRSAVVRELLGESALIDTPDVMSMDDLVETVDSSVLTAGAADFFTRLIGGKVLPERTRVVAVKETLLVCGSLAAWDSGRVKQMKARGFEVVTVEQGASAMKWPSLGKIMLAIGGLANGNASDLTERLVDAAVSMSAGRTGIRIALEGGATAVAFIRRMGWTRLDVVPEAISGVGSLQAPNGPLLWVKPGSYPWPEGVFT